MINYSLKDTFSLLTQSVGLITAEELVDKCKKLEMTEKPYIDLPADSNLPKFDKGYIFSFFSEDNTPAIIEILEKDKLILQTKA